jgi:RimJ/RimL family protein N-acetyltransferase
MTGRGRRLRLPIDTDRLCLREFSGEDLAAVTTLYSDRRVTRYMLYGPRDESGARRHLAGVIRRQRDEPREAWELAVTRVDDNTLIGACDLTLHSRQEAEIGYLFARRHWRQGYASEVAVTLVGSAFAQLGVERVLSTVEIHNERSLRVLDKAGLRWEATFRRYARARRHWWDVHLYAISREDWAVAQG